MKEGINKRKLANLQLGYVMPNPVIYIYIYIYIYTNESDYIMLYNSRAVVIQLLSVLYDIKSNVKLGWFRFKRPACLATLKSCDTTKKSFCG